MLLLGDIFIKLDTLYNFSKDHSKFINAIEYIEGLKLSESQYDIESIVKSLSKIMAVDVEFKQFTGFDMVNNNLYTKYYLIDKTRINFFNDILFKEILKSYKEQFRLDVKKMILTIKLNFSDWKNLFNLDKKDPLYPNITNCYESLIKDIVIWIRYNNFTLYDGLYMDSNCNIIIIFKEIKRRNWF